MRRIRGIIMTFLGFSKSEANATVLLVLVVILLAILPRAYNRWNKTPPKSSELEDQRILKNWLDSLENKIIRKKEKAHSVSNVATVTYSAFDPNLSSKSDLEDLGFDPRVAQRIVNYRKAGGSFKRKSDLKKIYGMDATTYEKLEPYILIEERSKAPTDKRDSLTHKKRLVPESPKEKFIPLDLNLASTEELQTIPGIGPYYSKRIIAFRNSLGGFADQNQIKEVYGLREEAQEALIEHTFLSISPEPKIFINRDSAKYLVKHPYISWNVARAIVSYRNQHGNYAKAKDICSIKIIGDSLFQKISPYISLQSRDLNASDSSIVLKTTHKPIWQ